MVDRVVLDVELADAEALASRSARTSGVKPEWRPVRGSSAIGRSSR